MATETQQGGITEQDRTLSDLLSEYRHLKDDPGVPTERKERADELMKPVWERLAVLQDPDGFMTFVSDYIQTAYQRRNHVSSEDDAERRTKPMCRCDLPRHVCESKQGEVPSEMRTQDLKYIHKPGPRSLARDYIQEHSGDVVVREAMREYRNLRADIYASISGILVLMRGGPDPEPGDPSAITPEREPEEQPAAADGGVDLPGVPEGEDDE